MFWLKPKKVFFTTGKVYAKAFKTLARGLWLTLAGIAVAMVGGLVFVVPLLLSGFGLNLQGLARPILVTAGVCLTVSLLLNLWGKYTCFELQQPLEFGQRLPGHRYLQIAFWCEALSFILKTSARTLGVIQLRWLVLPLAIISQITFLLFLRKVADVIERPDLKRRIDYLGTAVAGAVVSFGLAVIAKRAGLGPVVPFASMSVSGLLILVAMVGYLVLLAQMALAAGAFARYLEEGNDWDDDYDLASVGEEPAT